ncbi:unnamed protein product, partial [Medioppia subpectinata]
MESGAQMYNKDRGVVNTTEALSQAKAIAIGLKCNESEDWVHCLRRADPKDILKYVNPIATYPVFGTEFLPISARQAFNEKKFNQDIDLIAGIVHDEGPGFVEIAIKDPAHMTLTDFYHGLNVLDSLGYHNVNAQKVPQYYLKGVNTTQSGALRKAFGSLIGDLILGCPTYLFAKRFAQTVKESQRVYFYELLYASERFAKQTTCDLTTQGVCHGMDIPFVFGLPLLNPSDYSNEDIYYANYVVKIWSKFATDGHMNSEWPQLLNNDSMSGPNVKGLDPKNIPLVLDDPFHDTCDGVWADYYL